MESFFHWLLGDDSALSIAANMIALGTFAFGLVPAVRWANRLGREVSEIRRRLRASAGKVFWEHATLQNIQLISRVQGRDDAWNIRWSRLRAAGPDDWSPKRIDASKSAIVVGAVTYGDRGMGEHSSITVSAVNYIDGDPGWRRLVLDTRRWLARLLGEII